MSESSIREAEELSACLRAAVEKEPETWEVTAYLMLRSAIAIDFLLKQIQALERAEERRTKRYVRRR